MDGSIEHFVNFRYSFILLCVPLGGSSPGYCLSTTRWLPSRSFEGLTMSSSVPNPIIKFSVSFGVRSNLQPSAHISPLQQSTSGFTSTATPYLQVTIFFYPIFKHLVLHTLHIWFDHLARVSVALWNRPSTTTLNEFGTLTVLYPPLLPV
jgi:hypothetical protein